MNRRSVLVTGANSGIGKVIVSRLAQAGYDVALNFKVGPDVAEAIAKELRERHGCRAVAVYADVGSSQDVDAMFGSVIGQFGRLDALVNNAGVQVWKPLLEVDRKSVV